MIRTIAALKAAIEDVETVAIMPTDKGRMILCIAGTGRLVSKAALSRLVKCGVVSVLRTDLCGDPMQWGLER